MDAKSFFWLVSEMRTAQRNYFKTRDRSVFIAARALEDQVDKEIRRVKTIVQNQECALDKSSQGA